MPIPCRSLVALPLALLVGAVMELPTSNPDLPGGTPAEFTLIQDVLDPPATTREVLNDWVAAAAARAAQAAGGVDAELQGGGGVWQFVAFGRPVMVLSDPVAGRMRTMTPVLDEQGLPVALDAATIDRLMRANFDTALDARYAFKQGQLWSVYLHPLPTLTRTDFESGVWQVLTLAQTYGTTYSSTGFRFGGNDDEPAPLPPPGEQTI